MIVCVRCSPEYHPFYLNNKTSQTVIYQLINGKFELRLYSDPEVAPAL